MLFSHCFSIPHQGFHNPMYLQALRKSQIPDIQILLISQVLQFFSIVFFHLIHSSHFEFLNVFHYTVKVLIFQPSFLSPQESRHISKISSDLNRLSTYIPVYCFIIFSKAVSAPHLTQQTYTVSQS